MSTLTKGDAQKIVAGILPDGTDVNNLTPKARQEKREALDVVLDAWKDAFVTIPLPGAP